MKTYNVTLSADAIVSATVKIVANSPEEAKRKALEMREEDLAWEVGTLHEAVSDCGAYITGENP